MEASITEVVPNGRRRHEHDYHEQDIEVDQSPHECPSMAVSKPYHNSGNDNDASGYIQTFPESSFFKEKGHLLSLHQTMSEPLMRDQAILMLQISTVHLLSNFHL